MHKILIIDDNYTEVQAVNYALELAGYRVLFTRHGEEGLDLARLHDPALIVCDIIMPGMSGFEVLSILKLDPRTKNIPVVFLTAMDDDPAIVRGFDLGADDYIKKPYSITEVLSRIRRILNRTTTNKSTLKQYGQLWLSPGSQTAFIEGRKVQLSLKETLILNELMDRPNKTVSVRQLAAIALGVTTPTRADRHTIATHIYNLRHKKLRLESTRATYIHTEGHRGYRLSSSETGLELMPADVAYIREPDVTRHNSRKSRKIDGLVKKN